MVNYALKLGLFVVPFFFVSGKRRKRMTIKDNNYRDFSNRKSYNNVPCKEGEALVPFVVDREMIQHFGIDRENVETWNFSGKKVLVAFTPCDESKMDAAMKIFNAQVHNYFNAYADNNSRDLSLDAFVEQGIEEIDEGSSPEDLALTVMMLQELIEEVKALNPRYGHILEMLAEGLTSGEILSKLHLAKSQGYADIRAARELAKRLYTEN